MMTSTGLYLTLEVKVTMENELGSYFGAPQKKSSRGCRVRPDANANANSNANANAEADANRSKTICRPPLKGGRHKKVNRATGPIFKNQLTGTKVFFPGLTLPCKNYHHVTSIYSIIVFGKISLKKKEKLFKKF